MAVASSNLELPENVVVSKLDELANWCRKNSLWPMPFATACCGIELMATGASKHDLSRFGAEVVRFSPRQCDLMIVAGLGLGTFAAAGVWHRRSPRSLIGPGARTLRHGTIAAAVTFGFLGVLSLATLPLSDWPLRNQPLTTWLAWLPLGILALIFQTGAEEILFRGYLQSQLAARFRNISVAIVVPSILFGFAHYVPVFPTLAALTYVLIAALFGVLAADLTIRTGSIGAAWGFHFANNALAVLVVAPSGSITGLALWRTAEEFGPESFTSPLVTIEVLVLLASWALIRRALRV